MGKTSKSKHDIARSKVCIICLKRSKGVQLGDGLYQKLEKFSKIFDSMGRNDPRLPTGICGTCKNDLNNNDRGIKRDLKFPTDFSFENDIVIPKTRSKKSSPCDCKLCQISSNKGFELHPILEKKIDSFSLKHENNLRNENETTPACSVCQTVISKGVSHVCNDTTLLENWKVLAEKKPIVASALAIHVVKNTPPSPNGTVRLSNLHGPKFPLVLGAARPPTTDILLDAIIQHSIENNLSQAQARNMGTFLGKHKVKVQSGLKEGLVASNHITDPYMHVVNVKLLIKDKIVEKPLICCKNASEIVLAVFDWRKQNPKDFFVKLYFDAGRDYLKLSCSLIPRKGWHKGKKGRKLTGPNTVIILAIARDVPENSHNVGAFYTAVDIWSLELMKAIDHKMKNIDVGIMPNSSSYPCIECKAFHTDLCNCGVERTVADLANDHERFIDSGGIRKQGKFFFGQVDRPWLFRTIEEHKHCKLRISDIIVPSQLHVWLGIGNDYVHELGNLWEDVVQEWVIDSDVSKEGYWGGHFLGNALEKLFENIGFLEGYLDRYPLMLPYIVAMKSFNEVRKSCFGMDLHDDYAERIHKFQADQKVLQDDFGFSVTVKAHCLFYHFITWLDKW